MESLVIAVTGGCVKNAYKPAQGAGIEAHRAESEPVADESVRSTRFVGVFGHAVANFSGPIAATFS
jgi:hypothetical protein